MLSYDTNLHISTSSVPNVGIVMQDFDIIFLWQQVLLPCVWYCLVDHLIVNVRGLKLVSIIWLHDSFPVPFLVNLLPYLPFPCLLPSTQLTNVQPNLLDIPVLVLNHYLIFFVNQFRILMHRFLSSSYPYNHYSSKN